MTSWFAHAACLLLYSTSMMAQDPSALDRAWYIANFDLVWDEAPTTWSSAAFNGNGRLGTTIRLHSDGSLRFDIGDTYIYNGTDRTPIGVFLVRPSGEVLGFSMRQSLYRSEVTGRLETSKGSVAFHMFTDANADVCDVHFETTGRESLSFRHLRMPGASSRGIWNDLGEIEELREARWDLASPAVHDALDDLPTTRQLADEEHGTAGDSTFRSVPFNDEQGYVLQYRFRADNGSARLLWTTEPYSEPVSHRMLKSADLIAERAAHPRDDRLAAHYSVWEKYFASSYVSLPDKRIEANHWVSLYKIRAAARPGSVPIDLMGPWFRSTPWPRMWLNLNLQITYPFTWESNQLDVARTLFDYIDTHQQHFIDAVPEEHRADGASCGRTWAPFAGTEFKYEYGNFLWLMHNYSRFLEYFPDEERRKERYYPMLKRGVNFVLANLVEGEDGRLHFPPDISPEYQAGVSHSDKILDTNYNIALMKWALGEAIWHAERYEDTSGEVARYRDANRRLVGLLVDPETGLMVGQGYTMDWMHRHFSHLVAFYPLGLLSVDRPSDRALVEKSIERWLDRPQWGWGFKGYTYTAATKMYARLGDGDRGLAALQQYFNEFPQPNTFYRETGPVIETPLHAASAALELATVQSFHSPSEPNTVRVFTSVPTAWADVIFNGLRIAGGHEVSGIYRDERVESITLIAGTSGMLRVVYPGERLPSTSGVSSEIGRHQVLMLDVNAGETVRIGSREVRDASSVVEGANGLSHHFGLN